MGIREDILAKKDLGEKSLHIPMWDITVCIRVLTTEEREKVETWFRKADGETGSGVSNIREKIAVLVCTDENGNKIFKEDDVDELAVKSSLALDLIFETAMKVNCIGQKEIEEMEGKSEASRN